MACLKIVFVYKPSIIDNPYTEVESADLQYVGKLRYAKQMFTSLLFCPKLRFLSKDGQKKMRKNDLPGNRFNRYTVRGKTIPVFCKIMVLLIILLEFLFYKFLLQNFVKVA